MSVLSDFGDCTEQLEKTARSIQAIAHPTRLSIVCLLTQGEQCVQVIVDAVGGSQSNISQHLSILFERGILASRKVHNRVYYRIRDEKILQLVGSVRQVYCPDLQVGEACV